jgi:class 3 adenylate cyclase
VGETVEGTVVFIDVKDFSPVIRSQQPASALRRLNLHFEAIVPELVSRGGVVDKFVGDAVMAVFRGQGHLERALDGCLSARQVLRDRASRPGEQSPHVHGVSMGVDSGELLSGSIGAQALGRLDYTVLGDVVNQAAWLASLAGRDQLLIREALRNRLGASFECSAVRTLQLPGSSVPLAVCEVLRRRTLTNLDEPTLPPRPLENGEPPSS